MAARVRDVSIKSIEFLGMKIEGLTATYRGILALAALLAVPALLLWASRLTSAR